MITDVARLQIRVDSLEVQLADQRLKALQKQGMGAEKSVDKLGAAFGKFAAKVGLAAAAYKLVSSAFENIRSGEKLNAMLITSTGSIEAARDQMEELARMAIKTPFSLEGLTEAFIKLKNLGLDPSEEALMSYGETASSMGKGLEDIIRAIAGASVGEFEALKGFGIKAKIEGDKISLIFGGVKTTIENNAEAIQRYMIDLGNTKFAGSMALQMDTINGKLSNLEDAWFQFTVAVGENGVGPIPALIGGLTNLLGFATKEVRAFNVEAAGLIDLLSEDQRRRIAPAAVAEDAPIAQDRLILDELRKRQQWTLTAQDHALVAERILELEMKLDPEYQKHIKAEKELAEASERKLAILELYQKKTLENQTARRIERGDVQALRDLEEQRLAIIEQFNAAPPVSADSAVSQIMRLDEQIEKLNETIEKNTEKERERLETVTDFLKTEQELRREAYEERRQIVLDTVKDEQEAAKLISQLNRKEFSDKLKDARGFFDDLQELSGGGNEKIFRAQKALALATATVDGVMAVQKAATAFPFPYNIPGIAVETARAAASVAAISATEFSGAYADGGDPPVGKVALVGERGPELFIPKTAGTIIPNHKLGDSSGGIVVKIENHNVQTEVTQTQDDQGRQMLVLRNSIKREVKAEVARELNEGVGQVASGFNVAYNRNRRGGA